MLLEVDLIKVWLPERQVFLLFALLWVRNQFPFTTPLMYNFYQVSDAVFLFSVSVLVMLLFEKKIKVFHIYYAYLKCDNPLFNKKK